MKTLLELKDLIIDWANEKDLIKIENAPSQRLKLLEEVGETARAILKKNDDDIKDGIGDIFVVLVILFKQEKYELYYDAIIEDNSFNTLDYIFGSIIDFSSKNHLNGFVIAWLNFISERMGFNLTECANLAWNEIKDRKGETINGNFIKNN